MTSRDEEELTTHFARFTRPLLNGKDHFEKALEWLDNGKYNVKTFEKLLPNTAKDMMRGSVDAQVVGYSLMPSYVGITRRDDTSRLRLLLGVLAEAILPSTASFMAHGFFPNHIGCMMCYGPEGVETGIQSSMTDAIKDLRAYYMSETGMDLMTRELGGTFPRDSPMFKLNEAGFVNAIVVKLGGMDTGMLLRECEMVRRAMQAFLRVTMSFHPAFNECWECSKVVENISHCGGCKVAAYCSRKCQVAAWKGGHKAKCKRLKPLYKLHVTSVEEHEKAQLKAMRGILKLCSRSDAFVVSHCMQCKAFPLNFELERSMKTFYENLGRIAHGEWWIYDMSLDQMEGTSHAVDDTLDRIRLLCFLSVDWFGCARRTIGTDDPLNVTAWSDRFMRKICGPPISAEAFLEFYLSQEAEQTGRDSFTLSSYDSLRSWYGELD